MRRFCFPCLLSVALAMAGSRPASAEVTALDEARQLHRAGRLEEAARAYRAVIAEAGVDGPSRATAHNNLCVVLDGLGELRAAETECRQALKQRRELDDRLRQGRTLNNLGLVLQHLGEYSKADESFLEALEINREFGDARSETVNLANLGVVATLAGRFQQALGFNQAVGTLAANHEAEAWAAEQTLVAELNRGVILERLGAFDEAIDVYKRLLARSADIGPVQRASILVNSGVVYRNLGDPIRAIEHFGQAAELYRELGDVLGLASAKLNVGIAQHLNLKTLEVAEESYREVLGLVKRTGDRALEIETLVFLGRLLLSQGRLEEAQATFESGLDRARASGSAEGIWAALAGLGETEQSRGNFETALDSFQEAIEAIEESRVTVTEAKYRTSFFAAKRDVYAGAAAALAELDEREPGQGYAMLALEVAQRAKARDLLDALGSRGEPMAPLDSGELRRRLGANVLVEFFVTATDLLVWRATTGSVRLSRLGDPEAVLAAVQVVHEALASGVDPPEAQVEALSSALGGSLMPVPADGADLFIAPDRRLHYLPFELLPVEGEVPALLVEQARVSYLPSAWALPDIESGGGSGQPRLGFLGFGGVELSEEFHGWAFNRELAPLPESAQELYTAAKLVPGEGRVLTGAGATEAAFRRNAGIGASVIHFATHTTIGEGREGGTAILLSPAQRDDGLLYPGEIAGQPVTASLVVLAACATGLGAPGDGSALSTLTGSFLAAGSRAVLATLWPVGDQPTAVFMEQFYYRLSKGLSPAEALRRTKLEFLADQRWQRPELWSGYVLVGSSAPITTRDTSWMWIGALVLAVAVGLAIWRTRTPKTDPTSCL